MDNAQVFTTRERKWVVLSLVHRRERAWSG